MAEINDQISEVLEGWVNNLPFEGEGGPGILGDWVAVVCMVDVNDEGTPGAKYYVAMRNGNMLPHVIKGLLNQGLDEIEASDDDD